MNDFTFLFLAALAASFGVEYWLSRRQVTHIRAKRESVPAAFRSVITLKEHEKAADYTVEKTQLGDIDRIIGVGVLLALTLGGGISHIQAFWDTLGLSPIMAGIGTILTTTLVAQLVEIPLSVYQTFVIEQRYGFNRNTPVQFVKDLLLQSLVGMALTAPLVGVILWVMDSVGQYWWLLAWGIVITFSIVMSWAYPTFIAPLFNKFTPLPDETLRQRIEKLLAQCGFQSKGIFVMDGSRRSGHGNAYFTGIGDSKRIVFYDTLVESLGYDELEAVLAHELGHFHHKHVLKMLIASSAITLAGFGILGWVSQQDWFYSGLGVATKGNATALLLFMMVAPVFSGFLKPLMAHFQRRYEFEADRFAASQTRPSDLVNALVKLYKENASTLTPDPLYAAFHYSHPPASIRIEKLTGQPG